MNNIPYGFQSPLLAQKKLSESFNSLKRNDGNSVIIVTNSGSDTTSFRSTFGEGI